MPYEIVIIDDCSKDGSQELINTYKVTYPDLIKTHFNDNNLGIVQARNIALSMVSGNYVTWLDGDDIYLPNKLEVQASIVMSTQATLVYSNFYFAHNEIRNLKNVWFSDINQLPKAKNIFPDVITRNFPSDTLFRYELVEKELLKDAGTYDSNLKIYEDFDFRIRLCKTAIVEFTIEPLSVYRLHSEGLSKADKGLHKSCLNYIFDKYEDDINKLPESYRLKVNAHINALADTLNNSQLNRNTFKVRFKKKIIGLINKL